MDFIFKLKNKLPDKGSVIVYNKDFESGVMKDLAKLFPDYQEWIESILERMVDLLIPFKNFWYYHPDQYGSASLKKVLPSICGSDYSQLSIQDGMTASILYYQMTYENGEDISNELLEYCKMDTYAEYLIVECLKQLVS